MSFPEGALYNDSDPKVAAWLRNLIEAGHIAPGQVDSRSIKELDGEAVRPFRQFHAFAGIGGWSYALRLAKWPDHLRVWTGSCPCQPWSVAGKRKGAEDERHLWPEWFRLIRECRPPIVFGEQVAKGDGLGWLDIVSVDLEAAGYSIGSADLCAAGVGAPHIRQRLYFVAVERRIHAQLRQLGDAKRERLRVSGHRADGGAPKGVQGEDGERLRADLGATSSAGVGLADTSEQGPQRRGGGGDGPDQRPAGANRLVDGFWADAEWLACSDGKHRPVKPGLSVLAHVVPARVVRLRAYGNAIVPHLAATFIRASMRALMGDR